MCRASVGHDLSNKAHNFRGYGIYLLPKSRLDAFEFNRTNFMACHFWAKNSLIQDKSLWRENLVNIDCRGAIIADKEGL